MGRSSIGRGRRTATLLISGFAVSITAVLMGAAPAPATVAPAATEWCGSWIEDPAVTNSQQAVPGTTVSIPGAGYMRVNQGYYGPSWYAWTKEYSSNIDTTPALIWVYEGNGAIYECPEYSDYYDYTSGVRDRDARKVQAKETHHSPPIYGPAVYW